MLPDPHSNGQDDTVVAVLYVTGLEPEAVLGRNSITGGFLDGKRKGFNYRHNLCPSTGGARLASR